MAAAHAITLQTSPESSGGCGIAILTPTRRPGRVTTTSSIVVLTTIILYYQLYIGGAVATQILGGFHMTFLYYVGILVITNLIGAFASLAAGISDRIGRANLVVYGTIITSLLALFAHPERHTPSSASASSPAPPAWSKASSWSRRRRSSATSARRSAAPRRWASGRWVRCSAAWWSARCRATP